MKRDPRELTVESVSTGLYLKVTDETGSTQTWLRFTLGPEAM